MKRIYLIPMLSLMLFSCNKLEEEKDRIVLQTQETIQRKAQETVQESISNSINSFTNAEDVQFGDIFKNSDSLNLAEVKGKKIQFPNGSNAYVFKYSGTRDEVLNFLENQPTTDESRSDKTFRKIDGSRIIQTFTFIEKFLPEGQAALIPEDLKNDATLEYYKLKRYPHVSTLVFSPRSNTFYHYLELN